MSHCAHFLIESRSLQWINQNQDWHRKALSWHTRNCFTLLLHGCNRKPFNVQFCLTSKTFPAQNSHSQNVTHVLQQRVKTTFHLPPYKFNIIKADSFHSTHDNCTLKTGNGEGQLCLCLPDHKIWKLTAELKSRA